jgi:hypothetical protein
MNLPCNAAETRPARDDSSPYPCRLAFLKGRHKMLTQEEQDEFERIYQEERADGIKARADAAADRRIRDIATRPVKTRASRAKWRPQPVRPAGCVPLPGPHESYSTDGARLFNRDGRELKPHVSFTGVAYAKLYWRGGYDATLNRRAYKKYPLAEVFENASKTSIGG